MRTRIPGFSTSSLSVVQCFLLSLFLSTATLTGAWIHPSATKQNFPGRLLQNEERRWIKTPTSLSAGEGVVEFVNGLDPTLGNCEPYSAAMNSATTTTVSSLVTAYEASGGAVNMNIPNSAVLAGGVVAFLTFSGLALYLLYQQEGDSDKGPNVLEMNSYGIEELAPIPKVNVNENILSQQLQAAETRFQEQQPQSTPAVNVENVATALGGDEIGKVQGRFDEETSLREPSEKKLESIRRELTENREQLASETQRRKETESKLDDAMTVNEGLKTDLSTMEQDLSETLEKWDVAKAKLQEMITLKDVLEDELKQAAELNRQLEDKYELEQNDLRKTKKELSSTQTELEAAQNRVTRIQGELVRVFRELQSKEQILSETSEKLVNLEEEQRSIRTLGKKMWIVSKSRISNRIRSVGDRLRGRGPKKNKKRKKH